MSIYYVGAGKYKRKTIADRMDHLEFHVQHHMDRWVKFYAGMVVGGTLIATVFLLQKMAFVRYDAQHGYAWPPVQEVTNASR